jgi:hypothetical protein
MDNQFTDEANALREELRLDKAMHDSEILLLEKEREVLYAQRVIRAKENRGPIAHLECMRPVLRPEGELDALLAEEKKDREDYSLRNEEMLDEITSLKEDPEHIIASFRLDAKWAFDHRQAREAGHRRRHRTPMKHVYKPHKHNGDASASRDDMEGHWETRKAQMSTYYDAIVALGAHAVGQLEHIMLPGATMWHMTYPEHLDELVAVLQTMKIEYLTLQKDLHGVDSISI